MARRSSGDWGGPPLSIPEVVEIGIQIADAFNEARRKRIVHRDLKSANVILTPRGQVKVLDFGLAKQVSDTDPALASTTTGMTQVGQIVGTAGYMAPEQALARPVDHRSDIFSFGVVLYELLTGHVPFAGTTPQETLDGILHKTPPPIARYNDQIPDELERIVGKMLEKDPNLRYQSVHEIWVDLRRVRDGARPATGRRRRIPVRVRMVAVASASVVALAALLLNWPWRSGPVTTVEARSLVVLPASVRGAPELDYLTDAVASTLSAHLTKVVDLETKLPPSHLDVERVQGDVGKIAEAYRVEVCVVPSLTADGDRLILNVQVVEPKSRRVLWSDVYEGRQPQYLELLRRAGEGIRMALRPTSQPVASSQPASANPDAELALRRGQYYSGRYMHLLRSNDFDLALAALTRAIGLDPQLAQAAAEIAILHMIRVEVTGKTDEAVPETVTWARRALQLNPRTALAWYALAAAEGAGPGQASQRKVLEYTLRAVHLAPQDARLTYGLAHALAGSSKELASVPARRASELDPLNLFPVSSLATLSYGLGRAHEALPVIDQALAIEPDMPIAVYRKSLFLTALERTGEARDWLRRLEAMRPDRMPSYWIPLVRHALALREGDQNTARTMRQELMRLTSDPRISSHDLSYLVSDAAPFLASRGFIDETVEILERSLALGAAPAYDMLVLNPAFRPIRGDRRMQAIEARARAGFIETLAVLREARSRGELPRDLEPLLAELPRRLGVEK